MNRTKQICMYSRLVLVYCTLDITSDATECVRETRAKNCGRERNIKKHVQCTIVNGGCRYDL